MKLYLENLQKFEKADTASDAPLELTGTRAKLNHISGPYMDKPSSRERRVVDAIRAHLHPSLRHKLHKSAADITRQHGYVASEAAYHLLGGKEAGYKPVQIKHEDKSHWYLRHDGPRGRRHIDITHDQFETCVDHDRGRARGFLTKSPCKRSREVIEGVRRHLGGENG